MANELKPLVTNKEILTEAFLREIIDSLPDPPNSSAVELAKSWKDEAKKRITEMSVTLSHKVEPIVQLMLEQKLAQNMDQTFSTIITQEPPIYEMANKYSKCFNTWIDADTCVSFKAINVRLLGKVNVKDMFILTFFAFLTCKRTKFDNVLQLGVVGCSTSGKSTLFEACLAAGAHVTTNEKGVGRFQVGHKPVLMFQDVSVRTLTMSRDTEKIKTIARTEPTVTKIHSTTYTLPPLFIFYTSNERLLSHKFNTSHIGRFYDSQVYEVGRKRAASEESIVAVQNRFIEAFVRTPPPLNKDDLPESGGFQRIHAILGMFKRVTRIMKNYQPSDFFSPVLVQYVLHGLCANSQQYAEVMNSDGSLVIKGLVLQYTSPEFHEPLLDKLQKSKH